jgi:hypothetical protein
MDGNSLVKDAVYPNIQSRYCDKIDYQQPRFSLFSFIPYPDKELQSLLVTLKEQPDLPEETKATIEKIETRKPPILGVGKIRGAFYTLDEANKKAENIIQDSDSTNSIFTCMIGVPFPLVAEGYSNDTHTVNIEKETEDAIAQNVREKRRKEQKEIEEIKRREEALKDDVKKDPTLSSEENYITHRLKLAHLRSNLAAHNIKIKECQDLKEKCISWLLEQQKDHPEYEDNYVDRYMKARKEANIPDDHAPEGFMKYLRDPIED